MTAQKGFRGGYNPYRDPHGRFAAASSGSGGQQINDAIRRAAGRGMAEVAPSAPQLPPARSMDNHAVRAWYNAQTGHIPALNEQWQRQGVPAHERARRCHEIRHDARVQARALMADQDAVLDLRARDLKKYGNPDGPTFAYLVADWKSRGVAGDDIYESIIGGSSRTNAEVNARFAQPPQQQGAPA
jgi:hypothetical protein